MSGKRIKFDFNKSKKEADKDLNGNSKDDRFWSLSDNNSRKSYTMKFVPSNDGTSSEMYVKLFSHNFEYLDQNGKQRKYFGTCPSTYGKECPICQAIYDNDWWNGDDDDKALARKYGKKKKYLTNVLIVQDDTKPEMNGTIKMIRMSPQAFEKVLKQIAPDDADKNKRSYVDFHPYDIYNSADFYLDFTPAKGGAFPNWSESEFDRELGQLGKDDEETEAIFNTGHNLQKYLEELFEKSQSNEEVIERIGHVFDGDEVHVEDDSEYEEEKVEVKKVVTPIKEEKKVVMKEEKVEEAEDDEISDDDFDDIDDDDLDLDEFDD